MERESQVLGNVEDVVKLVVSVDREARATTQTLPIFIDALLKGFIYDA